MGVDKLESGPEDPKMTREELYLYKERQILWEEFIGDDLLDVEEAEAVEAQLLILKDQYLDLPEKDRTYMGKVRSWKEVYRALPYKFNFFKGLTELTDPQIYFIDKKGQLVVGDGCTDIPEKHIGLNYIDSRRRKLKTSYTDEKGETKTVVAFEAEVKEAEENNARGRGEKLPKKEVYLSIGLITKNEYMRINKDGRFGKNLNTRIWLEGGVVADFEQKVETVVYNKGFIFSETSPLNSHSNYGARYVLRAKLKF